MFNLLFILVGGAILGWLGKLVARDDIRIPTWLTVVCGIGGMLIGNFLYGRIGRAEKAAEMELRLQKIAPSPITA